MKLDKIDKKILTELQRDAGQTLETLAAKIGLSKTPTHRRVKALHERGVITATKIIVNPETIGLTCSGYLRIRLENILKMPFVVNSLNADDYVVSVESVTGDCDLLIKVVTPNHREFHMFKGLLSARSDVTVVGSEIVLETHKQHGSLFIEG